MQNSKVKDKHDVLAVAVVHALGPRCSETRKIWRPGIEIAPLHYLPLRRACVPTTFDIISKQHDRSNVLPD